MNTPAFVGISETHMYPELNCQKSLFAQIVIKFFGKIAIDIYGGGVALLVRNDITVSEVVIPDEYKDTEVCCVDLLLNTDKFRVIVYYRPPHYTYIS